MEAPIHDDGTLGAWTTTSSFSTARIGLASVVDGGFLYVLGGWDGGATFLSDVQAAPILPDGTRGAFRAVASFTTGREYFTSVAANGHVYVLGGGNSGGNISDVQVAPIGASGAIGPWTQSTALQGQKDADGG